MGSSASNPTEIEVRFSGEGGRTRVELEHRGWERLGDRATAARASYSEGWALVFGEYERRAIELTALAWIAPAASANYRSSIYVGSSSRYPIRHSLIT